VDEICRDLGVPFNRAKTFMPTQVLEILGLVIDTRDMSVSVTADKLAGILEELREVQGAGNVHRKQLRSLVGQAKWIAMVVPGGRAFLQHLIHLDAELRKRKRM
jgi:hypothetical protein